MSNINEVLSFLRLRGVVHELCISVEDAVYTGEIFHLNMIKIHWAKRNGAIIERANDHGGPFFIEKLYNQVVSYIEMPDQFVIIMYNIADGKTVSHVSYITGLTEKNIQILKKYTESMPKYEKIV